MQPLLNAFPQPNRTASNPLLGIFATNPQNLAMLTTSSARFDLNPNSHQSYFVRGSYSPSTQSQRGAFNFYTTSTSSITDVDVLTLTLGSTTHLNGSSYNDLRFGYSTYRTGTLATADDYGGAVPASLDYLFSSYPAAATSESNFVATLQPDINGYYVGRDVQNRQTQWAFVDGLHGTFLGGMSFRLAWMLRWLLPVNAYRSYTGGYVFNGIAGTMSGVAATARTESSASEKIQLHFRNASLFLQDTWRAAPEPDLHLRASVGDGRCALERRCPALAGGAQYGSAVGTCAGSGQHPAVARGQVGLRTASWGGVSVLFVRPGGRHSCEAAWGCSMGWRAARPRGWRWVRRI